MALIDFGETDESALTVMRGLMQRVHDDLYGNGRPGMLPKVDSFMTKIDTLESERKEQHNSNQWRLNIIIALISLWIAWSTYTRERDRPSPPPRATQSVPSSGHTGLPPDFERSAN